MMIEKKINKIVTWKEIHDILKLAKKEFVLVKIPKSIYNHPKMRYKIQLLKEDYRVFIEISENPRGRKRKIDDETRARLLDLLKEGYSLRKISKITGIPKSTIYDYVKDEMEEIKEVAKKNKLRELIYEFKEVFIKRGLYDYASVQISFKEMEIALEVEDYNKIMEIFLELKGYLED